jgi:hypothetical protein
MARFAWLGNHGIVPFPGAVRGFLGLARQQPLNLIQIKAA